MDLAYKASDPFVPQDRWIVTLSDGRTVFQDDTPRQPSAWRRLQKAVTECGLRITGLRLQARGQMVTMPPPEEVNGYWQASRIRKHVSPVNAFEQIDRGVGYIKNGTTHISWVAQDGSISEETRPYDPQSDLAGILHG